MRISVIVPNLSGEIYLQDCRASVEAQTGFKKDEIELIIIDDDRNSPKGVAAMRNLGLEAASGDFVLFLDSDDYIADNALERLVEASAGYPDSLVALKFRKTWYKRAGELAEQEKEGRPAEKAAGQEKNDNHAEEDEFGVRDIDSVLGILIPKRFIAGSTGLRFNEELKYYSDIPFVAELMARGGDIISIPEHGATRCVYYKRNRNDAIRYPSLSQIKDKNRYKEFETACRSAHVAISNAINAETDAQGNIISIDEQPGETAKVIYARMSLWSCICDFVCNRMTRGKHPEGLEWDEETLRDAAKIMHLVPKAVITSDYKGCKKRILLRLQKGKTKAAQRLAKLYVMNRKKKGLFGSLSQWKWNIYKRIFRKLPVKENLFLFESFLGKSYGDSCRAIYEYMNLGDGVSGSKKPEFVWVIDNKDAHIPGKHRECKPLSLKYFYYVARCGAWVNNMRQPAWYEKRPGVRFLETWHGTPLKKLVFDMEDVHSASPEYKMTFYKQSRIWDWLISDNRFSTEAFESAFLFPREKILELGYPRNDLLYGDDRDARAAAIRRKLGIPGDKRVVLYAPTWRDDDYYGPGQYKFELPLDLDMMESLKDEYFFILRTHYFIADHLKLDDSKKQFVKDCSRYNDIGELYLISDVLITDYSSVFFDYANLRRPILFYVYDFERYRDTLRGFYFDMESGVPGPLLFTNEEVLAALKDIEGVKLRYSDKYREFTEKFCSLDDGHAAERVVKAVFEEYR